MEVIMYLLPAPQKIVYRQQEFILKYNTRIILHSALSFHEVNYAKILQEQIEESLAFHLDISKTDQRESNTIFLRTSNELRTEEYQLLIVEDQITITGGDTNALLHGVQTLRQMIIQKGAALPCLEINDFPELKNRGFYHDVTRGRIPTLQTLKLLADKMSYYKLNQLQLYIEHSFLFKDFSEVWRDDTPLTAEEIMEFDRYCKGLNIELVPSVASFGHLHKILSTKTYEELCELEGSNDREFSFIERMQHHTVDVTNEKSFDMIKKMFMEFIPLFTSGQFNLCADETFDLGKGKSKSLADTLGTERIYVDFLKKLCSFLVAQGKRPMFWGDIIISNPEMIKELPKEVICLNWDYNTDVPDTNTKKLSGLGVSQYLCPGVHGWRHFINRNDFAYDNIKRMSNYAHQYNAEGLLNTDWGDLGHINHPEFSMPGMIYGAAFSWNSKFLGFDEINKQISKVEYQDSSESFVSIINKLASFDDSLWDQVIEYKEMSQCGTSEEELNNILKRLCSNHTLQSEDVLLEAIQELYQIVPFMQQYKRYVVKPYLVMAEGILLFHKIGAAIGQYRHQLKGPFVHEPLKLAVKLEYWFQDYKEIWRSQYKESELYRLQEIVNWYADILREVPVRSRFE
jgi:hypothetical protein